MERDHVCNECITTWVELITRYGNKILKKHTPGSDHVKVEYSGDGTEESTSELESLDPGIESEHEEENSDGFVVVGASYGTGDVSWSDTDECCGEETCTGVFHFFCKPGARMNKRNKDDGKRQTCRLPRR